MKRKIAVLGATGSIGSQSLQVINEFKDVFEISLATCSTRFEELSRYSKEYNIKKLGIHPAPSIDMSDKSVLKGNSDIISYINDNDIDTLLIGTSDIDSLEILLQCYNSVKRIAISNKEVIVAAGVCGLLDEIKKSTMLVPIDSEHASVYSLLSRVEIRDVKKVIITASGGPIYSRHDSDYDISNISPQEALSHPVWNMGKKVTIDSATLFNKGIEIMEAKYLFDLNKDMISVVIHPESIIHAMLEMYDGFVLSAMAMPDMRIPIQYSLLFPQYPWNEITKKINFLNLSKITFRSLDPEKITSIKLAYECLEKGNIYPLVYLAADEIAVNKYLNGEIALCDINTIVSEALYIIEPISNISSYNIIDMYKNIQIKIRKVVDKL